MVISGGGLEHEGAYMQFDPFPYMRFAKRLEYSDGIFMAGSGMNPPTREDLVFKHEDFSLDSLCANYGDPRNLDALANYCGCSVSNLALTAGSSEANFLVYASVCSPGEKVLIESPGYQQFFSLATLVGCRPVPLPRRPENGFMPDPAEFKRLLDERTPLVVLTNLHNPSMALMPESLLRELVEIAADNGSIVLVDEVYLDHLRPGEGDLSAWKIGRNVVVTSSLTKVYGLGALRCGWAVAQTRLISRMLDVQDIVAPELPQVAQNLAFRALARLDSLRPRARKLHEARWPVVKEWLDSRDDVEYFTPPGGITVWLKPKECRESGSLATVMRKDYGVLVVPGEYFQAPGWFRIGFKGEEKDVREGLARVGRALDDLKQVKAD